MAGQEAHGGHDPEAGWAAVPILPSADIERAARLYRALGFSVRLYGDGGYAYVSRGGVQIHLSHTNGFDPLTQAGMAYLYVDDVDEYHGELAASGALLPFDGLGDQPARELARRWAAGESIARIGDVADEPWGMREFALLDADNNLLRIGQRR